jgi:hypothetical protein
MAERARVVAPRSRAGAESKRAWRALTSFLVLALLCGLLAAGHGAARWAWLESPYDPRPLLAQRSPAPDGTFTFAVFGDSYAAPELSGLLKLVDARHPTFAVTTGDMVAKGGGPEADPEWKRLSDRAGWFLRAHPTWPVVGNHELSGGYESGLGRYRSFYGLEGQDHSFVFGSSKFIVLGCDRAERPAPPEQVEFVRRELEDRGKYGHVFVFRHYPFYTVGSKSREEVPNQETALTKLFEASKVTAVFSGHDHIYYRTRRGGLPYIISGSAGAGVYALRRLSEREPGDAYMGASGKGLVLHVPGEKDRVLAETGDSELFAVFIRVRGGSATGEAVSASGRVWERFSLQ